MIRVTVVVAAKYNNGEFFEGKRCGLFLSKTMAELFWRR